MSENQGKYIILEHKTMPNRGFRFWSINSGEVNTEWYKVIGYTDDTEEAIKISRECNYSILPTIQELEDYWRDEIKKLND
jgi:hypothetical protein